MRFLLSVDFLKKKHPNKKWIGFLNEHKQFHFCLEDEFYKYLIRPNAYNGIVEDLQKVYAPQKLIEFQFKKNKKIPSIQLIKHEFETVITKNSNQNKKKKSMVRHFLYSCNMEDIEIIKDYPVCEHSHWENDEFVLKALKYEPMLIQYIKNRNFNESLQDLVSKLNGLSIMFFIPCNEKILKQSVENDGMALEFVPKSKQTYELCKTAVNSNFKSIVFSEFNNRDIWLNVLSKEGLFLRLYNMRRLKQDEELIKTALKQNGMSLQFVKLKKTKELCSIAVQQNGLAMKYVPSNLRLDKELQRLALDSEPLSMEYIANPTDEMILNACEKHDKPSFLFFIRDQIHSKKNYLILDIFNRNKYSIDYFEPEIQEKIIDHVCESCDFNLESIVEKFPLLWREKIETHLKQKK